MNLDILCVISRQNRGRAFEQYNLIFKMLAFLIKKYGVETSFRMQANNICGLILNKKPG